MEYIDDFDAEVREGFIPKVKRESIDIPDFLNKREDVQLTEEDSAILNNIPGNTNIEEMNHLNELESVCQNWKETEWKRVLFYAPHTLITEEIERRFKADDEVRNSVKYLGEFLSQVKM